MREPVSDLHTPAGSGRLTLVQMTLVMLLVLGMLLAMRELRYVLMPLVFSCFLVIVLLPVQDWLKGLLPMRLRWMSTASCMALLLGVVAGALALVWVSVSQVLQRAPEYQAKVQAKWAEVERWAASRDLALADALPDPAAGVERVVGVLALVIAQATAFLGMSVVIFFMVLLALLEVERWRAKALRVAEGTQGQRLPETVGAVAVRVRQFLGVQTLISGLSGVANGLWLWAMGVEFALFWALLTFILNFIPNVGSIIAVILPGLLALVQLGLWPAVITIAGMTVIEQLLGNFVQPRMQGKKLRVSPLVLLFSLIYWSWAWGAAGAILAVPITVALLIIFTHIAPLRPVALLMSTTDEYAVLDEKVHE